MASKILFGDGPDKHTTDYDKVTLVGNWYEERLVTEKLDTTGRVLGRDVAPETKMEIDKRTTKQAFDQSVRTSTPPAKIVKPSLFSADNLKERMATYGSPAATAYTLGKVDAEAEAANRYLETTNEHFYGKLPEQAKATCSDPAYFDNSDHSHHKSQVLKREKDALSKTAEQGAGGVQDLGSKGSRGEITRRPGESGNVYGVSVFVDEYAKWGTACKGRTLGDTVNSKMTKHF